MIRGGNAQLKGFFRRQNIENSTIEAVIKTQQAKYYRDALKKRVQSDLGTVETRKSGEWKDE